VKTSGLAVQNVACTILEQRKKKHKLFKFHSKNNKSDPKIEPKSQPNHLTESTNLSQTVGRAGNNLAWISWKYELGGVKNAR
jgi:hypothetical protein